MDTFKRILSWMKPYKKRLNICWFLIVVTSALRIISPYITKVVVDNVLPNQDWNLLVKICLLLLFVTLTKAVTIYLQGIIIEDISQSVVYDLRTNTFKKLQYLPYSFYDHHHIGEIMSRLTGDIEGVRAFIIITFYHILEQFLILVFAFTALGIMSPPLLLCMIIICPLVAVAAWKFHRIIRPAHVQVREQNAVLNTRTQENIAGVRVVKAFAREDYEVERFDKDNNSVLESNLLVTKIWSKYYPIMDCIAGMALPVILIVGVVLIFQGNLTIGALIGATSYIWMIIDPMRQVASHVNVVTNGIVSSEKIIYYLDIGSAIKNPLIPSTPIKNNGQVDFKNVHFRYEKEPVFTDVSLQVKGGETIAVMGATGSGKTSLVNLLGRFYDVQKGSIEVNGVNVKEQNLQQLRKNIGIVMQETFLYSETIADNIRYGNMDASLEQVVAAAKIAQAHDFITQMVHGYDTIVGERGLGLSGGQKQRIALARAILINPQILILDDATSAIDMETEAEIQNGLQEVMKDRTTFIIAHRISAVRKADKIIVLQRGEIAEEGNHEDLLEKKGLYYQMFMDQTKDFTSLSKEEQIHG
ncbi:MAG: ABC transporter ATP-binding protein [Clostridiales bacterium]|nr:ABC transporter ATP-binding protein [Clostridiales bacterium]